MPRLPELEAMAIFATVVETGTITAAASSLGLSVPTVSKAVARLEQRISAPLFHRTSRRLTLTGAGRDLAERAARMLAEAEAAEAALMEQSTAPRGLVRMTAPMSYGIRELAPILPMFMKRHPGITIDLHLSDATVDLIAEGFDLALRIGILPDSSLRARKLAAVPRVAVAAPAYLERFGRPRHPSDLMDHACFGYAYLRSGNAWCFTHRATGQVAQPRPDGRLRVNNGEAVIPALLAGQGIAELPEFLIREDCAAGRLEAILPEWTLPQAGLYLITPPHPHQPVRVLALSQFLADCLGSTGQPPERVPLQAG